MSKNNNRQHDDQRSESPQPNLHEQTLLHLFRQLSEPDRRHVLRLLQALRDTAR